MGDTMEKYLALDFPGCPQDLANRLNQDLALPHNQAVPDVCVHPGMFLKKKVSFVENCL